MKPPVLSLYFVAIVALQLYLNFSLRSGWDAPVSCSDVSQTSALSSSLWIPSIQHILPKGSTAGNTFGGIRPRAFEEWKYGKVPCFPPDDKWYLPATHRIPAREGFFLLKEMKTGGSTAAGIHLRIARNEARRQFPSDLKYRFCKTRNDHAIASRQDYAHRNREKSFLWTVIRDPTTRATSQFFHFQVSRNKVEPTDRNFQEWIQSEWLHRYYLMTLSTENVFNTSLSPSFDPVACANQIMLDYDFIGITERMEESAVVLQLLLGLKTGDILYTNAKQSSGFDDGSYEDRGCIYIVPSFVSPGMKAYFQSTHWKVISATDAFLHQAANKSLDLTIERLGRRRFEEALRRFRWALDQVEQKCSANITYPCSPSGEYMKRRDCLWLDSGCGTKCMDAVAEELDLYE